MRALAKLGGAALQEDVAARRDLDPGERRLVDPAAVLEADGEAHAPFYRAVARELVAAAIAEFAHHQIEALAQIAVHAALAGHEGLAQVDQVLAAHLVGIDAEPVRDHVDLGFAGPARLGAAEAAERAGRRRVGHHAIAVGLDVPIAVGAGNAVAGLLGDQRAAVGIGARIEQDFALPGNQRPILHRAGLHLEDRGVLGVGEEAFLQGHAEAHRPPGEARQGESDRFGLAAVLAAEAAADIGHPHGNPVLGQAEDAGDLLAHGKRVLAARP